MVYTSLLAYLNKFEFKEAIPLASVIIFVQNTVLLIYYLNKRHPATQKPLIIFDNFLIILPCIFAGNFIGYVLYVIFPKMIVNLLISIPTAYLIYAVLKK